MILNYKNPLYYDVGDDIEAYPDCFLFTVWSHRGPGKTYSGLCYPLAHDFPILYLKRTIEDVNLICSANNYGFDPSPYAPINRDFGTNIKAVKIKDGIGAFYHMQDGEPVGAPVSYIMAMSAIKRFKGWDMSMCRWILLDEFIPQLGERVSQKEGELLLDLYMTVSRDTQKRGLPPIKLVLFANAEEISTPITNTLEIVDIMADLNASCKSHFIDRERGICLHHITREEFPMEDNEKTGIYTAMHNTAWGAKSFDGLFSNNDFTNVVYTNLKNFKCMIKLKYKNHEWYIYLRPSDGMYYMTESRGRAIFEYDLNRENGQKRFYIEQWLDLRDRCIEDKFKFKKYSMYDLFINYRKFFKI